MDLRQYLDPRTAWRNTSEVDKVRLYTRQSFVGMVILFGVAGAAEALARGGWVQLVFVAITSAAAAVALLWMPRMGGTARGDVRRPLGICIAAAVVTASVGGVPVALWVLLIVSVPVSALIPVLWSVVVAVGIAAVAGVVGYGIAGALAAFFSVVFMAMVVRLSIWLLDIVTELDSSRHAVAALSVAEERLRFSRDLHDVIGRSLSAIAVKSELAATLTRRGDDRAAAQMDEVRTLAQQSMTEARQLVRGYRSIDLAAEIDGASALLSAAGITTDVVGSPERIPHEFAEAAAWVVREGATNILRHSDATRCRIEVATGSVRMANDGPRARTSTDGSGIPGLRERLAAVGGSVDIHRTETDFTLTATFPDRSET